MNKLLIFLFAVCLVSTHAFVKRDTAPANENYLETIQKKFADFSKDLNSQIGDALNPDTVKKNFNDFVDGVNKAMNDMKAKPAS